MVKDFSGEYYEQQLLRDPTIAKQARVKFNFPKNTKKVMFMLLKDNK